MRTSLKAILQPVLRSKAELRAYLVKATALAVLMALVLDVINQLVFFVSWEVSIRSWLVTIAVAIIVAVPILYSIGKAHLSLHQAKADVERLSLTDPLTGLPNRRAIFNMAEKAGDSTLILVIVDIDRVKSVNDTHGHRIGDVVLCSVAQRMETRLKDVGIVGRLGGEEFAILSGKGDAEHVLASVRDVCQQIATVPVVAYGVSVIVTVSVGAAIGSGRDFDALYAHADRALYAAKAAGRNRIYRINADEGDIPREYGSRHG